MEKVLDIIKTIIIKTNIIRVPCQLRKPKERDTYNPVIHMPAPVKYPVRQISVFCQDTTLSCPHCGD